MSAESVRQYLSLYRPSDPQRLVEKKRSLQLIRQVRQIERTSRRRVAWGIEDELLVGDQYAKDPLTVPDHYSFQADMRVILPPQEIGLQSYVENTLFPGQAGEHIALEIGGPGRNLFRGFTPGFFLETAGVPLVDKRSNQMKREDVENHHTVLPGDAFSKQGKAKKKIRDWLKGRKVGLLIERLGAARNVLPNDPYSLFDEVSFWYSLLEEGGALLAELPSFYVPLLKRIERKIAKEHPGSLTIQYSWNPRSTINYIIQSGGFMYDESEKWFARIVRNPGAPNEFPWLSPLEVKHAYDMVTDFMTIFDKAITPFNLFPYGIEAEFPHKALDICSQLLSQDALEVTYPQGNVWKNERFITLTNEDASMDLLIEQGDTGKKLPTNENLRKIILKWFNKTDKIVGQLVISNDPNDPVSLTRKRFFRWEQEGLEEFLSLWNEGRGIDYDVPNALVPSIHEIYDILHMGSTHSQLQEKITTYITQHKGATVRK